MNHIELFEKQSGNLIGIAHCSMEMIATNGKKSERGIMNATLEVSGVPERVSLSFPTTMALSDLREAAISMIEFADAVEGVYANR